MEYLLTKEDVEGDPEFSVMVMPIASKPDQYPENDEDSLYVPERVMWRILSVANSYNLKFASHAPSHFDSRWVYRFVEVQWVIEELQFLANLLNDEFLNSYVVSIIELCSKVLIKPNKLELAFEGP